MVIGWTPVFCVYWFGAAVFFYYGSLEQGDLGVQPFFVKAV